MSKAVGTLIAALTLLSVACASEPERGTGPVLPGGDGLEVGARGVDVPLAPTTTAGQRIRSLPECQSYSAFSFGHGVLAFATLAQHEELLAKFETLAESFVEKNSEFAPQVEVIVRVSQTPAVEQTPDHGAELNEAFGPIVEWFNETCVLAPGEVDDAPTPTGTSTP